MHSPAYKLKLSKAISWLALAPALLVLANCAAVPASKTLTPLKSGDLAATQTLADGQGQWPAEDWWKGFNDPQLNTLMDEAFANAPNLKAAQARLDKAEATLSQVKAGTQADANLNASVMATEQSLNMGFPPQFKDFLPQGVLPLGRLTLDINYDLDLWGKSRDAIKGAIGQAKATQVEGVVVRQNLAVAIANAYVELNRLYQTEDELAELEKGSDIKLQLYQARADHSLDPKDVLLSAHDDAQQVAQRQAAVQGSIIIQKNLIAALVGAGPDRGASLTRPALAPVDINKLPTNVPVDLLGRRPDVVAARLRVEAQGQGIKYAKADFYPNISLTGSWGREALGLQYLGSPDSNFGSVGPAISLPLFHQSRLNAEYLGYEADYNAAVAAYDQTLTTALHETADAAASSQSTTAQIAAVAGRRDAAQQTYELTKARWGKGLSTKIDVITAHSRVVSYDSLLTDLQAQAYFDRIKFIAALGGGFKSE